MLLDIRSWPDVADLLECRCSDGGMEGERRPGVRELFYSSLESADFAWGAFFVCIWKLAI